MIRTATALRNPVIDSLAMNVERARANYNLTGAPLDRYEVCRHEQLLEDACRLLGVIQ